MQNQTPEQRESLWRGKLSAAAQAELRGQPDLELEARLTDALAQMPNAPVPSNFTARVLEAIELEAARETRSQARGWQWNWRGLWPRVAVTAAVLVFAGLGLQQHELGKQRAAMARSLSVVASARTVPDADVLNDDFDAIQRMSQSGRADNDLLVAMQ